MAAVELSDLDTQERVALLALLQKVVAADGHVSDDEREEIAELVDAFGEAGYREAFDEASRRFGDIEALKKFLVEVGRKPGRGEARELIMGMLLEAAIPGAIEGHESELIGWLSDQWKIQTTFDDDADE